MGRKKELTVSKIVSFTPETYERIAEAKKGCQFAEATMTSFIRYLIWKGIETMEKEAQERRLERGARENGHAV